MVYIFVSNALHYASPYSAVENNFSSYIYYIFQDSDTNNSKEKTYWHALPTH